MTRHRLHEWRLHEWLNLVFQGGTFSLAVVATLGLLFSGCGVGFEDGGSGSGGNGPGIPSDPTAPNIRSLDPSEGFPGDLITVNGFNLPLDPDANEVTFNATGEDPNTGDDVIVSIRAQVVSIVETGEFFPAFGNGTRMTIVVPNNVRTGFVNVLSTTDTDTAFAGALGFTGGPQLVTVALGTDGDRGRVVLDEDTLTPSPSTVQFVGYNFQTINACSVRTADGDALIASSDVVVFFPESPINPQTWSLPLGMSAVSVDIPAIPGVLGTPASVCPDGLTHSYEFNLSGEMPSGEIVFLPPVDIAFQGPFGEEFVNASITGVVLASGVRAGVISIRYNLFEIPSSSRWDVFPEFESPPGSGVWIECAGALSASEGRDAIPGGLGSGPNLDALLGPGMLQTFFWDTTAFDGGLPIGRNVARIRLRPDSPEEGTALLPCKPGFWETGPIAIDNDAATVGSVIETFQTSTKEDRATTTAIWDTSAAGVLRGDVAGSYFGAGTADIVLKDGLDYTFDTNSGEASRDGIDGADLFAFEPNLGRFLDPPEFHVNTFIMEDGANLRVVGDNPLIIKVRNLDGDTGVVAAIDGIVDLMGDDGARPASPGIVGGAGGDGGPGGGDGGNGGVVTADGGNLPGLVTGATAPQDGEFGGQAGTNIFIVKPSGSLNTPRPGAGGGGGHAQRGDDGRAVGSSSRVAPSGRGGSARGDEELTEITGGGGGGGGGGFPFRSTSAGGLRGRAGGGAGGGGGAFQISVNGTLRVLGKIQCDGGLGAQGDSGGPPGPGGGGGGGGIKLQASTGIELGQETLLRCLGGNGGRLGQSGNVQAGSGSTGRIRIESNGPIGLPGLVNFENLSGENSGKFFGRLADEIDGGTGVDGNLDLTGVTGTVIINTDTGELFLPGAGTPLVTSAGGAGEFHFSGLTIPGDDPDTPAEEGVIIRCIGDNPLIFRVLGEAEIAGTIDVSGEDGGQVNVTVDPWLPGLGGAGGPGGGDGGDGGSIDGDGIVHGGPGGFPIAIGEDNQGGLPAFGEIDPPPSDDPLGPFLVFAPTGGESVSDSCLAFCSGGHGGAGSYVNDGASGLGGFLGEAGDGGAAFGTRTFQDPDSAPLRAGGLGGAGGGAFEDTDTGDITPGTGGGGAGGYFELAVDGALTVRSTARILARGGDTFQAPDGGGNGGAGAGGGINISGSGIVVFETSDAGIGPEVSVAGGFANRVPNADFDSADPIPDYDGNGTNGGGNGSPGRIAIRSVIEFNLQPPGVSQETYDDEDELPGLGIHPTVSVGAFLESGSVRTVGRTLSYSVVRSGGVSDSNSHFEDPIVRFSPQILPTGTFVRLRYSGASEDPNRPGLPGGFDGPLADPTELDGSEYIQLVIYLFSDPLTFSVPGVGEIELPVSFDDPEDP